MDIGEFKVISMNLEGKGKAEEISGD